MLARWIAPLAVLAAAGTAQAAFPPLTPVQKLAAARAAGLKVKTGKVYDDCDMPIGEGLLTFQQVDLNGDGKYELMIDVGSPCYGNGGSLADVLVGDGKGGWRLVLSQAGSAFVLKTSHLGWKDIEIGGPGFGKMPVARWNGKEYR